MRPVLLLHGTWGRADAWHLTGSPLRAKLEARGHLVHDFLWSGVLAGIPTELPGDPLLEDIGADDGRLLPWLDAGEKTNLAIAYDLDLRDREPHVICHSHGLQVVTFAAALGQRFATVISLSGPPRRDMLRAYRKARGNIRHLVQVVDPEQDRTIREGQFGDGRVGDFHFDLETADENLHVVGQGHSGMTLDLAAWDALDLWARLRD